MKPELWDACVDASLRPLLRTHDVPLFVGVDAAITAAYEPQVRAALRTFYQHLVQEARPLAEAVRDIQIERNQLLEGGGVELPPMVRMMAGGIGVCGEVSQLSVEAAPFLAEN